MYWDNILKEVLLNKKALTPPKVRFTNIGTPDDSQAETVSPPKRKQLSVYQHKHKNYNLGSKYNGIYFTQREAECMVLLIKGKTINKTAVTLSLSPRTIEFYLKNMKAKLGCRTKFELVEKVLESDFLQGADFM